MAMLTDYERTQLASIEAWKNAEPGFVRRAFGVVISPLEWLVQVLVPDAVFEGAIDGASRLGALMIDVQDVLRRAQVPNVASLRDTDLGTCDRLADDVHNWAIGIASVEGSATGAMGLLGAPIDVPAIVTIAMRTIHKIGLCYGYECNTDEDRILVRRILAAAGATTLEEKLAALGVLTTIRVILVKQTWRAMVKNIARRQLATGVVAVTVYDVAKQIGVGLIRRRALAALPVAGALVGGSANGWYINEVSWAARRTFQERWLADCGKLTPESEVN